jgi:Prokaryotic homologs of the JAB domain
VSVGHLTAVESGFVIDDDGTTWKVIAGVTKWDRDVVLKLRERHLHVSRLFGLTGSALTGRSRSRSAPWAERSSDVSTLPAPPTPRSTKTRRRPKLRTGTPRLTVALFSSARRTIEEEFARCTRFDGLETGGWLFAERSRSWQKEIEVRIASGPGEGAGHSSHAYQPTSDYQETEADFARSGADHICRVGDWHSHPSSSRAEPSDGDLDAWQNCFLAANEKHNVAFYVGLIAALDNSHGRARMRLGAWCLSWDSLGRVTYEPARVA